MNKIDESDRNTDLIPEDDDVTDFATKEENKTTGNIRLKKGINVEQLLQNQGIILEPELDELGFKQDNYRQYFTKDEKDLEDLICQHGYDSEDDEDVGMFERISRKMTNLTKDGGVKKRIITPGLECDGIVPEKCTITIHYSLALEGQDEPFDSTYLRGKSERHRLDDNGLLPGLDIAIRSMKSHEKSEFIIESNYAFGVMGCPPRVPEKASILARIELLNFFEEGEADAILSMPCEERNDKYKFEDILKVVQKEHRAGNSYAGKDEYKAAAKCYERASKLLEGLELANAEEETKQKSVLLKLYRNRGLCYTKVNWPKKACIVLQEAMAITENDAKINYRMGIAKRMLCNYKEARKYLNKALQAQPGNTEIGTELASLDQIIKKERDTQRKMCQKMFTCGKKSIDIGESTKDKDSKMEDEEYAEIIEQLECFKLDKKQKELVLPSGFDSNIITMIDDIANRMDLCLVPAKFDNQYKVIRKS